MNNLLDNHLGKVIIGMLLFLIVMWSIFLWSIGQQLEQQGGLGKTIGHFIKDVNEGAK